MPYKKSYRKKGGLKKYIKSVVAKSIETKAAVIKLNALQVGAAGVGPVNATFNDLNPGDGQANRTGNQVTMTSVKWDLFINGTDATNSIRCIIYIPREPTVLIANLPFNAAVDYDQHIVLKDMFLCTSLNGNNCIRRQGYHSFKNKGKSMGMKTTWASTAPNDQSKGKVCFYMVSDSQVVPHPELNGNLRSFYKDA